MTHADRQEIPGFNGRYLISRDGAVFFNTKSGWSEVTPGLRTGYAVVRLRKGNTRTSYAVHRLLYTTFIGEIPAKKEVDHINRVRADNRLCNLRLACKDENQFNRGPRTGRKYKGTYFCKSTGKWQARLYLGRKCHCLGTYPTEAGAAVAYDLKALTVHGAFVRTNLLHVADRLGGR